MEIWRKNLYSIWIAQFFAMIGMSMVVPFLPFYIRELGISEPGELEKWSGIVFAGPFILSFILTPIWGVLGDRYGKKAMVLRAILGLSISQLLVGLAGDVYQLFIFRMFQGAVSGFIAASLALVTTSTPKEKSGYSIGVLQTSIAAGFIIGPLIGGFLADLTSYRNVFFITSTICFLSGILIFIYAKEPPKIIDAKKYTVIDNYKYSFSNSKIRLAMISITVVQISIAMTFPTFALFIESFELETAYISTIIGSMIGVTGIANVITAPWWGKRNDTKGFRKNLFIAMTGAAIALGFHTFASNMYELFPLRILLGLCIGGMIPVFYSYINKNITEDRKSGIMGIASSFTLLGNLIGPLLCTLLTFKLGIEYVFLVSGIILFVNALIVRNYIKDYRQDKQLKRYHVEIERERIETEVYLKRKIE